MRIRSKTRSNKVIILIIIDLIKETASIHYVNEDDYKQRYIYRNRGKGSRFIIRLMTVEKKSKEYKYYRSLVLKKSKKNKYIIEYYQEGRIITTLTFTTCEEAADHLGITRRSLTRTLTKGPKDKDGLLRVIRKEAIRI